MTASTKENLRFGPAGKTGRKFYREGMEGKTQWSQSFILFFVVKSV
jgi:hypothetical protein